MSTINLISFKIIIFIVMGKCEWGYFLAIPYKFKYHLDISSHWKCILFYTPLLWIAWFTLTTSCSNTTPFILKCSQQYFIALIHVTALIHYTQHHSCFTVLSGEYVAKTKSWIIAIVRYLNQIWFKMILARIY